MQQREPGETLLTLSGLELGRYEVQVIDPTGLTQVIPLQITSLDRPTGDPIPIQLDW